jgi:F-type H+-transporting ATPase subunit a
MGLEFLGRVRHSTLWASAIVALLSATYASPMQGLAVALGALWSLVNLWLIERLVVAVTGPDRGGPAPLRRAALSVAGMMGLFAGGAALLSWLPPATLLWGFLLPFGVIVLKAASLILLGSRAWKRGDSRHAGMIFALALATAAAGALPARATTRAPQATSPPSHATSTPAPPHQAASAPALDHAPASAEHGAAHGADTGPQKFANVITVLARAFPDAGWAHFLHEFEVVIFSLLIALLITLVAVLASRTPRMIPGGLQNVVETLVEALYDFIVGILGPRHGPRYVPFLGTLFIYILTMNLFGLIPFMDSPTSSLNVTVALAITVFLYAQAIGFRQLGVVGWLDHMLGNPRNLTQWLLAPLMLPIHLMGELAKPISLSARLFGNVFGEDMLLVAFVTLGVIIGGLVHSPVGLPLQLPFLFLALLTGTLQALVFTVLSTIYILLMLPHEEHQEHAEHTEPVRSARSH